MTDILTKLAALTAMDKNGLLPCWCGGAADFYSSVAYGFSYVGCTKCGLKARSGIKEDAVEEWNARPRETALIALVQEADGEISRIREAAGHGLSALQTINGRSADEYFVKTSSADVARYIKRILNPQEPGHG